MKTRVRCACWMVTAFLTASLLVYPAFAASTFPDVDASEEYAEAIEYLNSVGIMVGDDQGNFNPDKPVSRAEMATIICRLLGKTENLPTSAQFTDVPVSHWANGYISKAAELGVVDGYGNKKFGPSDTVKYEDALTMIVRAMGQTEYALELGGYPDGFMIAATELGYTNWISAEAGDFLTRWQVAIITSNALIY